MLVIYQKGTLLTYEEYFLHTENVNGAPAWKSKKGEFISRSSASGKWQIGESPSYRIETQEDYSSPFEEGISWDTSLSEDVDDILVTKDGKIVFLLYSILKLHFIVSIFELCSLLSFKYPGGTWKIFKD